MFCITQEMHVGKSYLFLSVSPKNSVVACGSTRAENKTLIVNCTIVHFTILCHRTRVKRLKQLSVIWVYISWKRIVEKIRIRLPELEKGNVKQRRVIIYELEEIHLERKDVFHLSLSTRHLCLE